MKAPPTQTPRDFSVDSIVLTMKKRPVASMVLAGIVLLSAMSAAFMIRQNDPIDEAEIARRLAADQVAYSAALRQSPLSLGVELATGSLEQGDALSYDEHLEDYFYYEPPDSSSFSIILTSAAFVPDLTVTTPDGRRLAASALMQTNYRAEVLDLSGMGRYEITVTTRDKGQEGAYEVSAGAPDMPVLMNAREATHEDTLGVVGLLRAGRYEQSYLVEARPGEPVILSVYAKDFTPRVHILGPEGEVVEPWSSVERRVDEDSTRVTVLRFRPGSEEPYLLLATSEERAAQGSYIVELETVRVLAIRTDSGEVSAKLGERSWFKSGKYIDTYRFNASADDQVVISVRSSEFSPRLVLRRGERDVASAEGGSSARIDRTLSSTSGYELDVTSVDDGEGGFYVVSVTIDEPTGPRTQSFNTEARRVGNSFRDNRFEVTVTGVNMARVSEGRVRVRLDVTERSLDFEGEWDEWARRARYAWVTDDTGRRYNAEASEAQGGAGDLVVPGGSRSGRLTFYGPSAGDTPSSITLHFPIGANRGTIVSIPVSLQR